MQTLRLRAHLLARVRTFFAERGVLEVDTPTLSAAAVTESSLDSFATRYSGPGLPQGHDLYLHTSPEFPMKRLLAAGSGCIYQVAKVFRNGEAGARHNPEFSLLEWYRVGFDHHQLMDDVEALVRAVLGEQSPWLSAERLGYADVFQHHLDLDPHGADVGELATCVAAQGIVAPPGMSVEDTDPWLDLLLSHCIEPRLDPGKMTFLYDYPVSQAAMARVRPGSPPVSERFELYLGGVELANGFHELGDAAEQRRRFEQDNEARLRSGMALMPMDENLLAALAAGLPNCAGVALGFDRLVMIAAGKSSLREVMAFPIERA